MKPHVILALFLAALCFVVSLGIMHTVSAGFVLGFIAFWWLLFLEWLLDAKTSINYKALRFYLGFLIRQLPNILQIVTFSTFMAYFLRRDAKAAFPLAFSTAVLVLTYLVIKIADNKLLIKRVGLNDLRYCLAVTYILVTVLMYFAGLVILQ